MSIQAIASRALSHSCRWRQWSFPTVGERRGGANGERSSSLLCRGRMPPPLATCHTHKPDIPSASCLTGSNMPSPGQSTTIRAARAHMHGVNGIPPLTFRPVGDLRTVVIHAGDEGHLATVGHGPNHDQRPGKPLARHGGAGTSAFRDSLWLLAPLTLLYGVFALVPFALIVRFAVADGGAPSSPCCTALAAACRGEHARDQPHNDGAGARARLSAGGRPLARGTANCGGSCSPSCCCRSGRRC